ncbi:translation initiation factor IF-2-like [Myiozetetes cayanensis]|uniref:translation initiation factor IF-2-like n=1 Tax=Myiozetetes cayanensis TaxID=478635 RepID=UPI00215DFD70|nr:translation initiation factor IF-2-like [Myiozetetes cayanensis]
MRQAGRSDPDTSPRSALGLRNAPVAFRPFPPSVVLPSATQGAPAARRCERQRLPLLPRPSPPHLPRSAGAQRGRGAVRNPRGAAPRPPRPAAPSPPPAAAAGPWRGLGRPGRAEPGGRHGGSRCGRPAPRGRSGGRWRRGRGRAGRWGLPGGGERGAGRVFLPASGGAAGGTARGADCRGRRTAAAVVVAVAAAVVVSASAARAAKGPAGPLAAEPDVRDAGLRRVGGEVLGAAAAAAAAARGEPLAVREAGKPCRELLFSSPPSFAFPLLPPPPPHQNRERRRVRCLAAPVLLGLLLQGFVRRVVVFCCFVFGFSSFSIPPCLLPSSLLAHCMLGSGWILPFIFGCASRKGEGRAGMSAA